MKTDISRPMHARRRFLAQAGSVGLAALTALGRRQALAGTLNLPFGNGERERVTDFPQKGALILQRTRPPMLETPFEVFDTGVYTPNDRFYVRWHLANIPTTIDPAAFRLKIRGHVDRPLELTLEQLAHDFEPAEIVAVNQCSGNSRGFFTPRVPGGEWANGAMGNARWSGVLLRDVLDRAGVRAGAIQVRFKGLDRGVLPLTPDFMKSLSLDHALDGEVMIAYAMNGETLPLLNGYPLRLVVPGWYATYWVKMLDDIEVLAVPDDNYWMAKAYLIPDTPQANSVPGQQGVKMVPINKMVPRSFFTNLKDGTRVRRDQTVNLRGIAFGGDSGVAKVLWSSDQGRRWQEARLGRDHGKYSFRQWEAQTRFTTAGVRRVLVKAINTAGASQPERPNWNASGFMRNVIESVSLVVT